jgi:hypothetical protein
VAARWSCRHSASLWSCIHRGGEGNGDLGDVSAAVSSCLNPLAAPFVPLGHHQIDHLLAILCDTDVVVEREDPSSVIFMQDDALVDDAPAMGKDPNSAQSGVETIPCSMEVDGEYDSDDSDFMVQCGQDIYDLDQGKLLGSLGEDCSPSASPVLAPHEIGPKFPSHKSTDAQADEDVPMEVAPFWPHFLEVEDIFAFCGASRASRAVGVAVLDVIETSIDNEKN